MKTLAKERVLRLATLAMWLTRLLADSDFCNPESCHPNTLAPSDRPTSRQAATCETTGKNASKRHSCRISIKGRSPSDPYPRTTLRSLTHHKFGPLRFACEVLLKLPGRIEEADDEHHHCIFPIISFPVFIDLTIPHLLAYLLSIRYERRRNVHTGFAISKATTLVRAVGV